MRIMNISHDESREIRMQSPLPPNTTGSPQQQSRQSDGACDTVGTPLFVVEGRILQKRKRVAWLVLTLERTIGWDGDDAVSLPSFHTLAVYVPRSNTGDSHALFSPLLFYLQSVIRVSGEWVTCLDRTGSSNNTKNDNGGGDGGGSGRRTNLEPTTTSFPAEQQQQQQRILQSGNSLVAQTIELLQCAPDPQAVQAVVASILKTTANNGVHSSASPNTSTRSSCQFALSTLLPRSLYTKEVPVTAGGEQRQKVAEERIHALLQSLLNDDATTTGAMQSSLLSESTTTTTTIPTTSPAVVYATIVRSLKSGGNVSDIAAIISERRTPRCRVRRIAPLDLHVLQCAEVALQSSPSFRTDGTLCPNDMSLETALQRDRVSSNPSKKDQLREIDHDLGMDDPMMNESFERTTTTAPMSYRGHQSRHEYWTMKKVPQVNWMVNRIATVMTMMSTHCQENAAVASIRHVLDIGGGRGDLALALAQRFPDWIITVVDRNATSVAAGQARAAMAAAAATEAARQTNDTLTSSRRRIHFIVADFEVYASHPERYYTDTSTTDTTDDTATVGVPIPIPPVDLVVALHACGDLSDAALHHATRTLHCSFVICPCCYTKRYLKQSFWDKSRPLESFLMTPPASEPSEYHPNNGTSHANRTRTVETCHATESHETRNVDTSSTLSTLLRLAELNEHPEICHRAAIVINTARLQRCNATSPNDDERDNENNMIGRLSQTVFPILQLEEFPNEYSKRNLVLVGIARSNPTLS